ncbi:MAG: hypothetical protein QM504_12515 [Pseudomonadota bacterium]
MLNKNILSLIGCGILLLAPLSAIADNSKELTLAEKKTYVQNYYTNLYQSNEAEAINKTLAKDYIEHQYPPIGTSANDLKHYIVERKKTYPNLKVEIHRAIAQNDLVFLQVEEKITDSKSIARGELFQLKGDKITQHWSVNQAVPDALRESGHMFNGTPVNTASTIAVKINEKLIAGISNVFPKFDYEAINTWFVDPYTQHTPDAVSGVESFTGFIHFLESSKAVSVLENKHVIAEGDFIVAHSFVKIAPITGDQHVFDIIRITEEGKIIEHWDIVSNIGSEEEMKKIF